MRPAAHGRDHDPEGADPGVTGRWHYVGLSDGVWSSGSDYAIGALRSHGLFIYRATQPSGPGSVVKEPGVDTSWFLFWEEESSVFQNDWFNASPTDDIPNPSSLRFRIHTGSPNAVHGGAIVAYSKQMSLEVQGDITGGIASTVVFTFPLAYRRDRDIPLAGNDDALAFVPCRVFSNGDFKRC